MMAVNVEVAFGLDGRIYFAVLAEVREHMVEKPDARIDFVFTGAIQIQRYINVGLFGLPVNFRRSLFHSIVLIRH
jgi:hypothetical protein